MKSNRLWIVASAAGAGLLLFLLLLWLSGIGLSDLVIILAAVGTIYGTVYMDRFITRDDIGQKIEDPWVLLMMRTALALSAASFITSLFGMIDFVMGSSTSAGTHVVGWLLALTVTFGIQGMLLATSVELGRSLQRMRRLSYEAYLESPRDKLEQHRQIRQATPGHNRWKARFAVLFVLACLVTAFLLHTGFSLTGLIMVGARLIWPDGQGYSPWLIAALVVLPLPLMLAVGWLRLPRGVPALIMLSVAFLFFLFFSSVFSYDNYYRLLQSDEDESQRRGSIVRESVPSFLVAARQSLEAERFGLLQQGPNAEFIDGMLADLDSFVAIYRTNLDKIAQDEAAMRETRRARKEAIQQEIDELRADEQRELEATADMLGDQPAKQAAFDLATEALAKKREELDRVETELDALNAEIDRLELLAKCEEAGTDNPELGCTGSSTNDTCGPRCKEFKRAAEEIRISALAQAEEKRDALRIEVAEAELSLRNAQIELETAIDQAAPVDGGESPVVVARREIRERYAAARKALQEEWATLDIIERRGGSFSADGLSTALANFRARPGTDTAQAFTDQCAAARLDLTSAGVTDATVTAYDCAPPQLAAIAKTAERLDLALETYEQRCTAERVIGYDITDPTATPTVPPPETAPADPATADPGAADPGATAATDPAADPAGTVADPSAPDPALQPPADPADPAATAETADAAAEADQNAIPVLRDIVNRTRACLSAANFGQDGIATLQVDLTELESIYLLSSADMRSSIQDLLRLNFFAVGAAVLAVGGDLLVLFAGAWASYRSDSPIMKDVLNPDIARTEAALKRAAAHHPPEYSAAVGMQRFLSYLEETQIKGPQDHFFRSTVNFAAVTEEDRRLVGDIMRALPTTMLRDVDYVPINAPSGTPIERRRAILQPVVDYMTTIAHSEQGGPPGKGASAQAGGRTQGAGASATAGIGSLGQLISAAFRQGSAGGATPAKGPDPAEPVRQKPEADV